MHSFALRIWFERTSSSRPEGEWRGHVTDVASLERRYFRDIAEVEDFVSDRIARDPAGQGGSWREDADCTLDLAFEASIEATGREKNRP